MTDLERPATTMKSSPLPTTRATSSKPLNGSQREYNFPALWIHRTTVREELVREVERQGIEMHWGKKCVSVIEESERGATLLFED